MRKILTPILAAAIVIGIAACDDDDPFEPDEEFSATLTGAAERPNPVTTDASGTAEFEFDDGVMSYTIDVSDITGVFAAHIHGPASTEVAAGVIVDLFAADPSTGTVNGQLVADSFTETNANQNVSMDSLLVLMRNGNAYVNVHTDENGGGEIRGQIQEN
ncbi:MAG: CHRD domain-containing protein [Planctomycetaceae bacterium]